MPSSYALGETMEHFVDSLVERGDYNSKSEVVREALRLLQEHERLKEIKLEEIRKAFRAGIESGPGRQAEEVFDTLEEKYTRMMEDQSG